MSWSEIRARAGSDMLSDTINNLIAQANMSEAIKDQITISDKISPITIIRSKLKVSDAGMMTCISKPRNHDFVSYMPLEPDGKFVRLDLKFDHGGEYLTDHSYMQNLTEFGYDTRPAVLIKGSSDDGVTAGKLSSILDGVQHYHRTILSDKNSIKKMVTDGFPGFSFVYRNFPLSLLNMQRSVNTQRAILVDYVENDSVQYAVRIEIDDDGRIIYMVRHNYQDYYLSTPLGSVPVGSNIPNYFRPDYKGGDYDADVEQFQIIYPIDYIDLGFTFDFATKRMQIYRDGTLIGQSTSSPALPAQANLSLWLPMNEGSGNLLRDISGLNNNGDFSPNLATDKPTWGISPSGRRYLNFDMSDYVKIPYHASLDTFTSFTVSFFMYANADFQDPTASWKAIIGKKYSPFSNGGWRFFANIGNSARLNFEMKSNAGVMTSAYALNAITAVNKWYHVVGTYDGTNQRIYVNKVLVMTTSAPGLTLSLVNDMFIGSGFANYTDTARMRLAHVMLWKNAALSQAQINTVYDIVEPLINEIPATQENLPPDFIPPQKANLSLWLPMNNSLIGETVNDISGNNNHGNFAANVSTRKPVSVLIDGKPKLEFGAGGDYIAFPKNTTLNPLTSFTVSFFMYLYSDFYSIATSKILFGTGFTIAGGSILVYNGTGNNRGITMDVRTDAAAVRFIGSGGTLMPDVNNWVHVAITYDGLRYRFYINNVLGPNINAYSGDTFTNTSDLFIGSSSATNTGHEAIAHLMFYKNKALVDAEIAEIYNTIMPSLRNPDATAIPATPDIIPVGQPMFPPGFEEPAIPPPPGTPYQQEFEKIYDNATVVAPVVLENLKINKITVSNQTSIYNVGIGTPVSDPYVPVYDVPQGIQTDTTTTTPVSTVYTNPGTNSHGGTDSSKFFYGQRIKNTNSDWYNKIVTDVTMYLTSDDSGVCTIGILKNDGVTFIPFGATFDAGAGITTPDQAINRTNFTHGYALQVGDAIGVKVDAGTVVDVQRAGSHVDVTGSTPDSCQSRSNLTAGDWSDNTSYSMAAIFKDGGILTGAVTVPYVQISNAAGGQYQAGEVFPTNSPMVNNKLHKLEFTVWRDATINNTPTVPTVNIYHLTSAGAIKSPGGTLKTVDVSTLPTADPGVNNFTWENPLYDNAILAGERIVIATVGLTTGKVKVKENNGKTTGAENYDTTRSYLVTRNANAPQGFNNTPTLDLTGKMFTGGNDFVPYIRLDHSRKRVGIKCATANSDLIGQKPTKVTVPANRDNAAIEAAIYCRIRAQDGTLRETIGQVDSSGVAESDTTIEFLNTGNNYAMALNDIISIEYDQGTATDYIKIGINKNQFDGADTILSESLTATINTASPVTDRDLAAQIWIGGQVDPVARPARGWKINNNSVAQAKPLTEVRVKLKRTGTFGALDKIICKIIKWTTKASVITIGEKICNDISNSVFTEYIFQNTGNAYPMEVGDLVLFEQNNGNSVTQFIEIQTSKPPTEGDAGNKDDIYTAMFEYNGQTYTDDLLRDVIGSLWIGGFMVFPDPSIPFPPDPHHYFHGWHINASTTPDSGSIIEPSLLKPRPNSFFNTISDQFRLYSKVLTAEQFTNYFLNRWTITPIGFGGPQVMGYDFVPYDEALE